MTSCIRGNPREENVTSNPRLTRTAFKRHGDAGRGAAGVRSSKRRRLSQKRMLRIMESPVALSGSNLGVQRRMSVAAQKIARAGLQAGFTPRGKGSILPEAYFAETQKCLNTGHHADWRMGLEGQVLGAAVAQVVPEDCRLGSGMWRLHQRRRSR